jgi:hypothetical protein
MSNQAESKNIVVTNNCGFMQISTIDDALKCAEVISKTGFCPKSLAGKPNDVVVALQMGQELGLAPMQALQNIAVINSRPSLWGDAMLAVCRQSPSFEYIKEEYLEDKKTYVCRTKRRNEPEVLQSFSEEDARRAGLWNKEGPWKTYPKRMLQMRARGFALRDAFPDLLRGIIIKEEAEDYQQTKKDYSNMGNTYEGEVIVENNELINYEQTVVLENKITEAKTTCEKICAAFNIEDLSCLQTKDFDTVMRRLDATIKKNQASEMPINQMFKETE